MSPVRVGAGRLLRNERRDALHAEGGEVVDQGFALLHLVLAYVRDNLEGARLVVDSVRLVFLAVEVYLAYCRERLGERQRFEASADFVADNRDVADCRAHLIPEFHGVRGLLRGHVPHGDQPQRVLLEPKVIERDNAGPIWVVDVEFQPCGLCEADRLLFQVGASSGGDLHIPRRLYQAANLDELIPSRVQLRCRWLFSRWVMKWWSSH